MKTEPETTFKVSGLNVDIVRDEDAESPETSGDEGLFLVADHRQFYVAPPKGSTIESVMSDYKKTHHIFSLEAYIHSGVVLALGSEGNFPDRQWDVSQLGAVFVSRKEWRTKDKARAAALSLIEEWNQYLSGDVYLFRILDEDNEELSGMWGIYGLDNAIEEATSMAKWHAKDLLQKHIAKKKAEIKNRVPLMKRKEK